MVTQPARAPNSMILEVSYYVGEGVLEPVWRHRLCVGCGGLQRSERTPAVLHYNVPNVLTLPFRLELRATA
jgi:hypothetical protein